MVPKFRGDSDDWLDDECVGSRARPARGSSKKTRFSRDSNGVVVEVFPKLCKVRMDSSEAELLCSYRRAEIFPGRDQGFKDRAPVAVGDRVCIRQTGQEEGVIDGLSPRKNFLSRPAPGRDGTRAVNVRHVIAANVEGLVIVASVREPEFSIGIVDRYLLAAQVAQMKSVICVTKMDLADRGNPSPWRVYGELGYSIFEVCSKIGFGIEGLRAFLKGETWVFCGHSGVGKTSLLRILLNQDIGRVGVVNFATGKGRHTTTSALMTFGPDESRWIDTPGTREFGLTGLSPEQLKAYYPEFRGIQCEVAQCLHLGERGCKAEGFPRHASYRRICESLIGIVD